MSSSSHELLLTSSPDGTITAYDTFSGTVVAQFTGSRSPRSGLALAGKGYIAASHISSTTASGSIHLYNWWTATAMHHILLPEPVAPLRATPDGFYLFAGGLSGYIHAIEIMSGNIITSCSSHRKPVSCLEISDDSSLLLSGGDDGTIVVLPIFHLLESSNNENSSDVILNSFVAHDGPVTAIRSCMGLSQSSILSCSMDCTCKLWSLLDGTIKRRVTFPCSISKIALDPTETEFFTAGSDGFIYRGVLKVGSKKESMQGNKLVRFIEKHNGPVVSVVMLNMGRNLASAAEDGSVYVWDTETENLICTFGNNMEILSDMVVATGISDHKQIKNPYQNVNVCVEHESRGLFMNEAIQSIQDGADITDALAVAAEGRSKAIDMLESAISLYERLLELILKEAKGSSNEIQ